MFTFNYKYNLLDFKDIINIKKKNKIKKLNILDYGCGTGVWKQKDIERQKIKIFLYDKNKKLLSLLKKKYNHKKIKFNFNKKKIFKPEINMIILSSVLQYMNNKEFEELFQKIKRVYKTKKLIIFINDHPLISRYCEIFLLPFINWRKLFYSISIVFNIDYLKTRYFYHDIIKKNFIKKNFIINYIGHVKDMKMLRGKFLLKLK